MTRREEVEKRALNSSHVKLVATAFDGLKVKFIENCPWGPEIHIYYFGNGIADIFDIDLETADDLSVAVEAACGTLGLDFAEEIMRKRRLK